MVEMGRDRGGRGDIPGHSVDKNPPTNARSFSPWAGKISCRRKRQTSPVFLPGESSGERSVGLQSIG